MSKQNKIPPTNWEAIIITIIIIIVILLVFNSFTSTKYTYCTNYCSSSHFSCVISSGIYSYDLDQTYITESTFYRCYDNMKDCFDNCKG
jgi:hypothetical protein